MLGFFQFLSFLFWCLVLILVGMFLPRRCRAWIVRLCVRMVQRASQVAQEATEDARSTILGVKDARFKKVD